MKDAQAVLIDDAEDQRKQRLLPDAQRDDLRCKCAFVVPDKLLKKADHLVCLVLIKDEFSGLNAVHDLFVQHPDPFSDDLSAVLDALIIGENIVIHRDHRNSASGSSSADGGQRSDSCLIID